VSLFCLISVILTLAFGVLMVFHLYLMLWVRAGTYTWMMGGRVSYHERARARAQKQEYEAAHRRQKVGNSNVMEGHITANGDIEFTKIKNSNNFDSGSSFGEEHASASGDDVSESVVSSAGTVELNDPDIHIDPRVDADESGEQHELTVSCFVNLSTLNSVLLMY
jgi:hypothetical protein